MSLLEELKEKEARLAEQLGPVKEQYERLSTELAMVRHGIRMLDQPATPRRGRQPLPEAMLAEAEAMRAVGAPWAQVAQKLGVTVAAVQKAVERRSKGNPHLRLAANAPPTSRQKLR